MSAFDDIDGGLFAEWLHHPVTSLVLKNVQQDIRNTTVKLMAYARASSDPQVRATVYDLDCLHKFQDLMTEKERKRDDDDKHGLGESDG